MTGCTTGPVVVRRLPPETHEASPASATSPPAPAGAPAANETPASSGTLSPGAPADITILAPDLQVTVDKTKFASKSKNTPYHGWSFTGGVAGTIVGGKIVYANPAAGFQA